MAGGGGGTANTEPGPAQAALAGIARDQFADWKNRLQPQTTKLIGQVRNPAVLARDLSNASSTIGSQFSEQKMDTARGFQRMGVTPTAQQQALIDRQGAIAQAGVDAAARTKVRQATYDRGNQIIGGV